MTTLLSEHAWGPIIEAIEAGHITHGTHCVGCREESPCSTIVQARRDQLAYAERLRIRRTRDTYRSTQVEPA